MGPDRVVSTNPTSDRVRVGVQGQAREKCREKEDVICATGGAGVGSPLTTDSVSTALSKKRQGLAG